MHTETPVFKTPEEIGRYSAQILADSLANGVRLTTLLVTFPRFILAEVNTHRVFSRNSASSRAIPTAKIIERLQNGQSFVPATFNERVVGMGIGKELNEADAGRARDLWGFAMEDVIIVAEELTSEGLNIDKSRANRLLEPFMWHTAIISFTEADNFFALRCPSYQDEPDPEFPAQWEFQQTALLMKQAMAESDPVDLPEGEWHRPMVDNNIDGDELYRIDPLITEEMMTYSLNMLSSRRLARVSFDKHTEGEKPGVSLDKAGNLAQGGHFSPMEHIARAILRGDLGDINKMGKMHIDFFHLAEALHASGGNIRSSEQGPTFVDCVDLGQVWSGNLRGFWQFRKEFEHEANHGLVMPQ